MHDILRNRFRGAIVGAYWGEAIGTADGTEPPAPLFAGTLVAGTLFAGPLFERLMQQIEQFLPLQDHSGPLAQTAQTQPLALTPTHLLILDSLPIALFYHDQPQNLKSRVRAQFSDPNSLEAELAIVIGQLISLILRERFRTLRSIDWLTEVLGLADLSSQSPLLPVLRQIQDWSDRSIDLASVTAQTNRLSAQVVEPDRDPTRSITPALLLALYSFLTTPDQVQLTLWRWRRGTNRRSPTDPLVGLVLGLMAGLQQGLLGIPAAWQARFLTPTAGSIDPTARWTAIDRWLALWSGIHHPEDGQLATLPITAAPRVIRAPT